MREPEASSAATHGRSALAPLAASGRGPIPKCIEFEDLSILLHKSPPIQKSIALDDYKEYVDLFNGRKRNAIDLWFYRFWRDVVSPYLA